jgi:hypothetical protein
MADDDDMPAPSRPKEPDPGYTHGVYAFKRIGKKYGRYREVGDARAPACEHCGAPYGGKVKIFVDRLIAFGGGTGGFLLEPQNVPPPRLAKDFPEQRDYDEKDILPGSGEN